MVLVALVLFCCEFDQVQSWIIAVWGILLIQSDYALLESAIKSDIIISIDG
jgi:hypothetical protein